jgi:hypothetical protein
MAVPVPSPIAELVVWTFLMAVVPLAAGGLRDYFRAPRKARTRTEGNNECPDVADLRRAPRNRRRRRRAVPRRRERVVGR